MRIISGKHKGRRIKAPQKLPVRPTTDRAKEALFNILQNQYFLSDLKVLDLFAGTGNISFEFASRGTTELIAVDAHPGCAAFIRTTAETLDLPIATVKSDVISYLKRSTGVFDLIFADPPYDFSEEQLLELIGLCTAPDQLKPEGSFILEHTKEKDFSSHPSLSESRKYGGSVFSFFELKK
ncbi:RsmD family RNA methyltransferase [Robiginitalea sp. IMCC43444]|uniref:RsmD family RNA methyltransferase n=1 Tax=Robiginitalea sp. IMCC43444 TaxID=3459121 RepID=UPI00404321C2